MKEKRRTGKEEGQGQEEEEEEEEKEEKNKARVHDPANSPTYQAEPSANIPNGPCQITSELTERIHSNCAPTGPYVQLHHSADTEDRSGNECNPKVEECRSRSTRKMPHHVIGG